MLQDRLGAVHVRFDGVNRPFAHEPDADGGSEMEYHVDLINQPPDYSLIGDRVDGAREVLVAEQMFNVLETTGRQIVQHRHRVPLRQEPIGKVRSEEARAARDECPHAVSLNHMVKNAERAQRFRSDRGTRRSRAADSLVRCH